MPTIVTNDFALARKAEGIKKIRGWGYDVNLHPALSLGFSKEDVKHGMWHLNWVDHFHRLKYLDGRIVFVSEPYHLGIGSCLQLVALEEAGWNPYIRGVAEWHPNCLRITLCKAGLFSA